MGQPQPQMGEPRLPVAGAPAHSASAATLDDDEWEYEYDAGETEDLYFTLDLTTHVPDALVQRNANLGALDVNYGKTTSGGVGTQNGDVGDGANSDEVPMSQHTLQFLDLHTRNPLVKLDDGTYSCYWTTDLGTQFHIAQSGVVLKPRHSGAVLDVVGTSRSRLIGQPVTLIERQGAKPPHSQGAVSSNAINLDDDESSDAETNDIHENGTPGPSSAPGQPLVIPRENCKNLAAEKQASFLERLSMIKLKKGEDDQVPIYSVKIYKEPENVEELKQQALAADAAMKRQQKDKVAALKAERPRKRRKRLTAAEKSIIVDGSPISSGRPDPNPVAANVGLQETSAPSSPAGP